jgi:hypothetical protein
LIHLINSFHVVFQSFSKVGGGIDPKRWSPHSAEGLTENVWRARKRLSLWPPTSWTRNALWKQEVSSAFVQLSKAQVYGLVLWSAGIALSGSSGISQISALLAQVLGQKEASVTQRLRKWYPYPHHKRGDHRRELEVTSCFGPLLRWIVARWLGEERRLASA